MNLPDRPGALVVSLDFEQAWGMRDHVGPDDASYHHLRAARQAVTDLVSVFGKRRVRATWATVGFLFASTRSEATAHLPKDRPIYALPELNPYVETIGADEEDDPEHLAGSLVDLISATAGQEVGSHTFSHFYCLERGQNEVAFRADLAAAQSIAHWRGLELTSLVLPRNQWNPAYADAVLDSGFRCIRGPQRTWGHRAAREGSHRLLRRGARLADTYAGFSPPPTTAWDDVQQPSGLCDVPASAFLRPFGPGLRRLEPLRLARLRSGLRHAARRGRIFHLWWHPHNFAQHQSENFAVLEHILDEFDRLATVEGMESLNMADVTARATQKDTRRAPNSR